MLPLQPLHGFAPEERRNRFGAAVARRPLGWGMPDFTNTTRAAPESLDQ